MKLREVTLVAGKELRETLRDRRTLAVMVLFPLVVYPLVSLVTAQVLAARVARVEAHVARVAVSGPPVLTAELLRRRLAGPEVRSCDADSRSRRRLGRQSRRRDSRGRRPDRGQAVNRSACYSTRRARSRPPRASASSAALAAPRRRRELRACIRGRGGRHRARARR